MPCRRSQRSMRYALVRIWAVLAVGLLAGALGDGGTEFVESLGWLGGATRDADQQGLGPAFALGAALALGLAVYVVASRIAANDPLLRKLDDARARAFDALLAFGLSCVTLLGIEGYETQYGGLAPFHAGSVVVEHAPVLIVGFLAIAIAARVGLGAAIRAAARSGEVAVALWSSFLRIDRSRATATKHDAMPHPDAISSHVAPDIVNARGLRAPPLPLPALLTH
jgi:hypothetical protein